MAGPFKIQIAGQERIKRAPALDCLPVSGADPDAFAQVGIQFGDVYEDDRVWRRATVPEGWFIDSTLDPTKFILRDPHKNPRAEITYVDTSTTRLAWIVLRQRYGFRVEARVDGFCGIATDAGEAAYRSKPQLTSAKAEEIARDFVREHYSDWESYSAYWE